MKAVLRHLLSRWRRQKPYAPERRAHAARSEVATADEPEWLPSNAETGETVYGDRPLRFHTMTVEEIDHEAHENPAVLYTGFKIRVARRPGRTRQAGNLVEKRYSSRGYATAQAPKDPNLFTFIAYDEGILVGTVALRLDSPRGLSADQLYKVETDRLRAQGFRLCEFTRLAVDKTVASKPVLAGLFHTAYLYASVIRGYTHAVIEVNPRHVAFYKRALGFEPLGPERMNQRVNAPGILLAVAFTSIKEGLRKHAGKHEATPAVRSLFPYGFSDFEEAGVLNRLRELVTSA